MCGPPLFSKVREMNFTAELEAPPPSPTNNKMFISSLMMPIFRRVKGFLVNLLFAYYNGPTTDPTGSPKAIESPTTTVDHKTTKNNNNTMDIMAAFAAQCAEDKKRKAEHEKSTNSSKIMLESILSGLPQYNFPERETIDAMPVNPTKKQLESLCKSPNKSSTIHRKRPSSSSTIKQSNTSLAMSSSRQLQVVEVSSSTLHFVSLMSPIWPVPSNKDHHHHQHHPRKSTILSPSSKKSLTKNNREKKRNELTRNIHEDTMWEDNAIEDDDQDTVDHCCIMLETTTSAISSTEPTPPDPQSTSSPSASIHILEQFCRFTLADFPIMSSFLQCSSSTIPHINPPRPAISWEIFLDRVPAERPARLQRLARRPPNQTSTSSRRLSRRRLYSEDNDIPPAADPRLSAENLQQYRAQFNAGRVPRERQISEASDDFICFEESDECVVDNFLDEVDDMFGDSDDSDDDDDLSECCETESEEESDTDGEDGGIKGEINNNNKKESDTSAANRKTAVIANPADSGYEDKKVNTIYAICGI